MREPSRLVELCDDLSTLGEVCLIFFATWSATYLLLNLHEAVVLVRTWLGL